MIKLIALTGEQYEADAWESIAERQARLSEEAEVGQLDLIDSRVGDVWAMEDRNHRRDEFKRRILVVDSDFCSSYLIFRKFSEPWEPEKVC